MAYSIIAEFDAEPDWQVLHDEISRVQGRVELFPISNATAPALGLSIPLNAAPHAISDVEAVLTVIARHGGIATDLYSGRRVDALELPRLRERLEGVS